MVKSNLRDSAVLPLFYATRRGHASELAAKRELARVTESPPGVALEVLKAFVADVLALPRPLLPGRDGVAQ
jgi:hypothetical protein